MFTTVLRVVWSTFLQRVNSAGCDAKQTCVDDYNN